MGELICLLKNRRPPHVGEGSAWSVAEQEAGCGDYTERGSRVEMHREGSWLDSGWWSERQEDELPIGRRMKIKGSVIGRDSPCCRGGN